MGRLTALYRWDRSTWVTANGILLPQAERGISWRLRASTELEESTLAPRYSPRRERQNDRWRAAFPSADGTLYEQAWESVDGGRPRLYWHRMPQFAMTDSDEDRPLAPAREGMPVPGHRMPPRLALRCVRCGGQRRCQPWCLGFAFSPADREGFGDALFDATTHPDDFLPAI